jgi:hypothetical protein
MSNLVEILILLVNTIFDQANQFLTSLSDAVFQPESGSGVAYALAVGATPFATRCSKPPPVYVCFR